jgi:hypothetical protein
MRKKLLVYSIIFIFFIPVFILICYAYQNEDDKPLSGIYYQVDGSNVTGKYALLFKDGIVYLGLKGDTQNEIINDVNNLNGGSLGIHGKEYTLNDNKIIIYRTIDKKVELTYENGKIIVESGEIKENCVNKDNNLSVCSTSIDGIYKKQ